MEMLYQVLQLLISVCNADARSIIQLLQPFKYDMFLFSVLLSPTWFIFKYCIRKEWECNVENIQEWKSLDP